MLPLKPILEVNGKECVRTQKAKAKMATNTAPPKKKVRLCLEGGVGLHSNTASSVSISPLSSFQTHSSRKVCSLLFCTQSYSN